MPDPVISPMRRPAVSRFESVQALRFFAAFAVVVCHSSFYATERLSDALGIYAPGANGVRLFFVISGFVMIASTGKLEGTPLGWRVFVVRRIVRIVPIYWVMNAIKLALMLAVPGAVLHAKLDWVFIAKSLLFIPAINIDGDMQPFLGVGWTLNFEMFFYLLITLALLLRLGPTRTLAPLFIGLALLSPVARAQQWPVPLQFWADPIVLDFLAGMLFARVMQRGFHLPPPLAWLCILAGLVYLFAGVPQLWPRTSLSGSLMLTLAGLAILAGAVALDDTLTRLTPRAILYMGGASYALYLIHPIIAPVAPMILNRLGLVYPLLSIMLSILIALIGGALTYRLIEEPATVWLNERARESGLYKTSTASQVSIELEKHAHQNAD